MSETCVEGQLAETFHPLIDQKENIKNLCRTIADKVIPMKLVQTRLDAWAKRPNVGDLFWLSFHDIMIFQLIL